MHLECERLSHERVNWEQCGMLAIVRKQRHVAGFPVAVRGGLRARSLQKAQNSTVARA